jgi:dolichol-phosphate mannosyltransferase
VFRGVDLAVVLPTLNEEHGLPVTLKGISFLRLLEKGRRVRVLVIDGGSTDRTVAVARSLGIQVIRQHGKGKGQAVREALAWLRECGARNALVMDADSTYPGDMVGTVLELLEAGSHLVVGVREPKRNRPNSIRDLVHRIGNAVLNYAGGQVSGRPVLDLCSGFWGLSLSTGLDRALRSDGFDVEAELFLKAYRGGYVVTQIPIEYGARIGTAKLRAARDGARIMATILRAANFPQSAVAREPPRTSPFLRELLSVCVVHGSDSLVVWADPSRRQEAGRLVRAFRHSDVNPRLHLDAIGPTSSGGFSAGAPPLGDEEGTPVVSLRSGPETHGWTDPSRLEVFLAGPEQTLRLELDSGPGSLPSNRSGGIAGPVYRWLGIPAPGAKPQMGSLRFLRASLGAGGLDRDLTFYAANGMRASVVEPLLDSGESGRSADRTGESSLT